jgi:hypothetical protein
MVPWSVKTSTSSISRVQFRNPLFYFAGTIQESFLFIPQGGEPILMVKKSYARAMKESALANIVSLEKVRHIPGILRDGGFGQSWMSSRRITMFTSNPSFPVPSLPTFRVSF